MDLQNRFQQLLEVTSKDVDPKMEYHDELPPKMWKNNTLIANVKPAIMKVVKQFFADINFTPKVLDVTILGSACNYNYSDISDLDVHIIVDYDQEEMEYKFLESARKNWMSKHNIEFKGFKVEIYCQYKDEKISKTAAIYSLQNNKWIREPNKETPPPNFNNPKVLKKSADLMTRIDAVLKKKPSKEAELEMVALKDEIKNLRKEGIAVSGEFDVSNLVFKTLRNNKYMDKLVDHLNKAIDVRLSVK